MPKSANAICRRDEDSTHSVRLMKNVVLVLEDPHGLI